MNNLQEIASNKVINLLGKAKLQFMQKEAINAVTETVSQAFDEKLKVGSKFSRDDEKGFFKILAAAIPDYFNALYAYLAQAFNELDKNLDNFNIKKDFTAAATLFVRYQIQEVISGAVITSEFVDIIKKINQINDKIKHKVCQEVYQTSEVELKQISEYKKPLLSQVISLNLRRLDFSEVDITIFDKNSSVSKIFCFADLSSAKFKNLEDVFLEGAHLDNIDVARYSASDLAAAGKIGEVYTTEDHDEEIAIHTLLEEIQRGMEKDDKITLLELKVKKLEKELQDLKEQGVSISYGEKPVSTGAHFKPLEKRKNFDGKDNDESSKEAKFSPGYSGE